MDRRHVRREGSRRQAVIGAAVGAAAAIIVLGPTVQRGFVLTYDMVFVPHMSVTTTTWGMDGSVPRAVPTDLLVALLGHLLPGDIVQKVLFVTVFVLGGAGAARLVRGAPAAVASAAVYVWNPWVLERLVIGHWTYLLGLAVLPWAVAAAGRLRNGDERAAPATAGWVVVAGLCGSSAGLVVAGSAALVALWPGGSALPRRRWRLAVVALPALGVALAWLLPAVLIPGGIPADPAGVRAFAARADSPLGTWGSLLTLGGLWNPATWPPERKVPLLAGCVLAAVVAALVAGVPTLIRRGGRPPGPGLVVAGAAGFVLAGAGATPGLEALLRWVVVEVPGGGLLRDGQKLLMPTVLLVAWCIGSTVERLVQVPVGRPLAVLLAGVPVLLLPSLAWGVHGRLGSVAYPAEWTDLQRQVAGLPEGSEIVSFPFSYYRRFVWNGNRVVLDPLPRLLGRVVVVNDDLPLSDVTVRGEDAQAAAIRTALDRHTPLIPVLRAQGVRYAVVTLSAPGAASYRAALTGGTVLHSGRELVLVDIGPATAAPPGTPGAAAAGWGVLALTSAGVAGWRIRLRRRRGLLASP